MKATDIKRIAPFYLIASFVAGLAHYFIYTSVTRSLNYAHNFKFFFASILSLGLFSILIGIALTITSQQKKFAILMWIGFIWMGFFHLLFFSSVVEFVISTIYPHVYSYWNLIFSFVIGLWALYQGLRKPQIITHQVSAPAEIKGMKIVQISDLHVGLLHLNANWLAAVVESVNSVKADIVAITGDLVEGTYQQVSPQLSVLKNVTATTEKFYITGNHEYIHGSGPWEKRLRELGYTTLHNENKVIHFQKAKVLIAGVPDRMARRFDPRLSSEPDLALRSSEKVNYRILLAHEPASRLDMKTETCDLILSGHTHGGQIFPFGLIVRMVQPVVSGFKMMGDVLVFAHQGTGFWGPPMRWFSRSEIIVIQFT